jgi:hypothetical protein
MNWHARFEEEVNRRHPGMGIWYTRVSRQPGWVTRTAVFLAVLVVVVPLVLLTLAAVVVGLSCLLVLGLVAKVGRYFSALFGGGGGGPRDDGRRNVRVINRP